MKTDKYYEEIKKKGNRLTKQYGLPNYTTKYHLGYTVGLLNEYKPKSIEEFEKIYYSTGEKAAFNYSTFKGNLNHGRTREMLQTIANNLYTLCQKMTQEEWYDYLVVRGIRQSFIGWKAEEIIKDELLKKDYVIKEINDADIDSIKKIDIVAEKDGKRYYFQVKPYTFFIANTANAEDDRKKQFNRCEEYNIYLLIYTYKDNCYTWLAHQNKKMAWKHTTVLNEDGSIKEWLKKNNQ